MKQFEGVVMDIRLESRVQATARWQILLDRTEFGRGAETGALEAVARSGARLTVPVLGVEVDATGEVWHVVEKPLTEGTVVTGCVGTDAGPDAASGAKG